MANHSAGIGVAELTSFVWLYLTNVGRGRPLAGFAHPIGFRLWPMTVLHPHLGTIPSTYEAAFETLEAGVPILVFPGGDYETLRPITHWNRVDFGGRKGFLKIARQAGVPIVPMGIRRSHLTAPILVRARFLAWLFVVPRLAGIKRWGVSALSCFVGALAALYSPWLGLGLFYLFAATPLGFIPWIPVSISFHIGAPLRTLPDDLELALSEVESNIQSLL